MCEGLGVVLEGRHAEIPQRHSPASIATPRKRNANAVTPWFLSVFPTRPCRKTPKAGAEESVPLANGTGGGFSSARCPQTKVA